jgi:CRISPR/Cas system-associated protein Cas5 (RAMP superfamily)
LSINRQSQTLLRKYIEDKDRILTIILRERLYSGRNRSETNSFRSLEFYKEIEESVKLSYSLDLASGKV